VNVQGKTGEKRKEKRSANPSSFEHQGGKKSNGDSAHSFHEKKTKEKKQRKSAARKKEVQMSVKFTARNILGIGTATPTSKRVWKGKESVPVPAGVLLV